MFPGARGAVSLNCLVYRRQRHRELLCVHAHTRTLEAKLWSGVLGAPSTMFGRERNPGFISEDTPPTTWRGARHRPL